MKSPVTWALVSNGVRARILRDLDGDGAEPSVELVRKTQATHLRDVLTDKPGRSFASDASGRRSAMEPGTDPILRDMQDFAREMVDLLDAAHRAGKFSRLAVLAAPKMLGILRKTLPASLRACVVLEQASNLIWLPEADLRDAVLRMLHVRQKE